LFKSLFLAVTIVAHGPGFYTSLSNHLKRWLRDENIAAQVVTPQSMAAALAKERLAFLVGFESPTAAELQTLRSFRARGGKLVVFHSGSAALGELMGVKPLGFRKAAYPGEWSRINFTAKQPVGLPSTLRQTSTVLHRAAPVAGKGRVIATWADRSGKSSGEPAWIATSAGFWMTHVLLADGDEDLKAQLVGAIVGSVEPGKWSFGAHAARADAKRNQLRALALKQVPRPGEIHAVWEHSGCGLYPGNWPRTMRLLKEAHVTDLFVNVAGAGFAHYPSAVLPRSRTFEEEGDQLAACLAAAQGTGIRVHAWMLCFTATRSTPERLEKFKRTGWRLKTPSGTLSEYLDPSNPAVRAHVLAAIDEMQQRYPSLAGIHLDFVRWYEGAVKPRNAAEVVSRFVVEARRHVRRPRLLTTAVLGKYPACIASVGQDWDAWLESNIVDYVVPMDYSEDNANFESFLKQHAMLRKHAARTIVGIGVTANESRLDARKVIEQISLTRRYGMAGTALFDLDVTLEKQILPYLKLGMW